MHTILPKSSSVEYHATFLSQNVSEESKEKTIETLRLISRIFQIRNLSKKKKKRVSRVGYFKTGGGGGVRVVMCRYRGSEPNSGPIRCNRTAKPARSCILDHKYPNTLESIPADPKL